jgi:addiction module HigA family antidote
VEEEAEQEQAKDEQRRHARHDEEQDNDDDGNDTDDRPDDADAALYARARPGEHPGFLMRRCLEERHLSQQAFAALAGCQLTPINEVLCGRRRLTPRMAFRISRVLGGTVRGWLRLQADHDAAGYDARLPDASPPDARPPPGPE